MTPAGSELLETVSVVVVGVVLEVALMAMLRAFEAVCPAASFTAKVKVLVPVFAGLPDSVPELENVRPVLHDPEQPVIDHVYGAVPPEADKP